MLRGHARVVCGVLFGGPSREGGRSEHLIQKLLRHPEDAPGAPRETLLGEGHTNTPPAFISALMFVPPSARGGESSKRPPISRTHPSRPANSRRVTRRRRRRGSRRSFRRSLYRGGLAESPGTACRKYRARAHERTSTPHRPYSSSESLATPPAFFAATILAVGFLAFCSSSATM